MAPSALAVEPLPREADVVGPRAQRRARGVLET
jgi:hypothetical protein